MGIILTFASIHRALAAERAAQGGTGAAGRADPELVPLPPRIKSDCGFGLLVPEALGLEDPRVLALAEAGIAIAGAYRVVPSDAKDGSSKECSYERIA
jgi:hypothetical protein